MTRGDTRARRARPAPTSGGWAVRLAGALLVALGLANAVFGVLSLATDLVQLSPGAAGSLLIAGLLTAGTGVLVWGGSRLALAVALTVFGILLVLQIGESAGASAAEGAGPRLAVLVVVVAALATAQLRRPPRRT